MTESRVDVLALVKMLGAIDLVDPERIAKRVADEAKRRHMAKKAVRS